MYLIPRFPVPSETFVAGEVLGLRELGLDIQVLAFAKPQAGAPAESSPSSRKLAAETAYLSPPKGLLRFAWDAATLPARVRAIDRRLQCEATHPGSKHARLLRATAVAHAARHSAIVRLHAHWPAASIIGALASEISGLPLSISVHAHEVEHDAGHFPAVLERADLAVFCNEAARQHLVARLPWAAEKARLVYHGVDVDAIQPIALPSLEGCLRIFSAGRLTPTKGFDLLIRAVRRALAEDLAVDLTIAGDGPERAHLERLVHELRVSDAVHLVGWLPQAELAVLAGRSHVFTLLPATNFHDGLPNVLLEAMASGRPVVVSPLPAAPEAVLPEVNGWISPSHDDLAFVVHCWRQLAADRGLHERMALAARETVVARHSRRRHLRTLAALLHDAQKRCEG